MKTKTYNKDKTEPNSTGKKTEEDKHISTGENEILSPHLRLKKNKSVPQAKYKQNLAALWTAQQEPNSQDSTNGSKKEKHQSKLWTDLILSLSTVLSH